jgi:hypothetical protein
MWTANVPSVVVWLLTAGLVIGILGHRRLASYSTPILPFLVFVPLLLVAQRVVPIARVWIFLLPLFAVTSAAGLWFLLRAAAGDSEERYSRLSLIAAAGLLGLTIVPDLRGTRVPPSFLDTAEPTALWLKTHLGTEDVLLIDDGIKAPVAYYLRRVGIPLISRPAPCDTQVVTVFASKARFAARAEGGTTRLFMVAHRGNTGTDWSKTYGNCVAASESIAPQSMYVAGGLRVFEKPQIEPNQWSMLGLH